MLTPVLIPARNEEEHIAQALSSLPKDIEPIVLANGCTDNTVAIAHGFGATVLERPDEGKMPALQDGIKYLGDRALEPFITLDADSFPLFPSRWSQSMLAGLKHTEERPAVIVGPVVFSGGPGFAANAFTTVQRYRAQVRTRTENYQGFFAGRNMLIHPVNQKVVGALLELENFWPGEDYAIRDTVVENNGTTYKTTSPSAAVVSDAARNPTLRQILFGDKQETRSRTKQSYISDRPQGAIRYFRQTDPTYTPVDLTDLPTVDM